MHKIILAIALINLYLYANDADFNKNIYNEIIEKLPQKSCKPTQVFRECYAITEEECEALMTLTVETCWKRYGKNITASKTLDDLVAYGNQIGECSGALYDIMLQKANKADAECLEVSRLGKQLKANK